MNQSVRSQKGFEELKPGDCSCKQSTLSTLNLNVAKQTEERWRWAVPVYLLSYLVKVTVALLARGRIQYTSHFQLKSFVCLVSCVSVNNFLPTFPKVEIPHELQPHLRKHEADVNISEVFHPLPKHTHGRGNRTIAVKSSEGHKQKQHKVSVFLSSSTGRGERLIEAGQVQLSAMGNSCRNLVSHSC